MTSETIRDPVSDHLLTPQNSSFIIIDHQPVQVNSIASMDRQLLVSNIVGTCKAAVTYDLPIVHSTVNVKTGLNEPPIPQVRRAIANYASYDRTSITSWEDVEFARRSSRRAAKKLIIAALWTEACLTFPALDALKEGCGLRARRRCWRDFPHRARGGTSPDRAGGRQNDQGGATFLRVTTRLGTLGNRTCLHEPVRGDRRHRRYPVFVRPVERLIRIAGILAVETHQLQR